MDLFQGHIISEKVDIWALGVILFKLAFFQTPFEDNKGNVDAGAILKGLGDRRVGDVRLVGGGLKRVCKSGGFVWWLLGLLRELLLVLGGRRGRCGFLGGTV